jgi:hypothetical protein
MNEMISTNRGKVREPNDNYPPPRWLIDAELYEVLVPVLGANRKLEIFEPACGDSAIVAALGEASPRASITATDIINGPQYDFLTMSPAPRFGLIITNPPYRYAKEFVERALQWRRRLEKSMVAMMLRVNLIGSQARAAWRRENPPAIHVTPKRPSFGIDKNGRRGTDSTEYAWLTWGGKVNVPRLGWLHTEARS